MIDHPFANVPPPSQPGIKLHWRAPYENVAHSIAAARDLARGFLYEAAAQRLAVLPDRTADSVVLVVSELVTNAARHDGGPRLIDLVLTDDAVDVAVWDTSTDPPVRYPHDPTRIGGHGIEIVTTLCTDLNTQIVPGGKRVNARLPLP